MRTTSALLLICVCICIANVVCKHLPATRHKTNHHEVAEHEGRQVFVHVDYDVEVAEGLLPLDDHPGLSSINCSSASLILHFANKDSCDNATQFLAEAQYIVASPSWGCVGRNPTKRPRATSVIERVRSFGTCQPILVKGELEWTLAVDSDRAGYADVLRNAKVQYRSNKFAHRHALTPEGTMAAKGLSPRKHTEELRTDAAVQTNHRVARNTKGSYCDTDSLWGDIVNGIEDVAKGIVDVAKTVGNAVKDAWDGVKALVTGNYQYNNSWQGNSISFNSASGGGALGPLTFSENITCTDCFMNADYEVNFDLSISDYSLQELSLMLLGNIEVQVNGTLMFNEEADLADNFTIATVYMEPPLTFMLGPIPVVIDITVPIVAGFDVRIDLSGALVAVASASGPFSFGLQKFGSGNLTMVHNTTALSRTGQMIGGSIELALYGQVFIMPTFVLELDYLGGGSAALYAALDLTAIGAQSTPSQCPSISRRYPWGLQLGLALQLSLTLSADIDIHIVDVTIYSHTWGPWTVMSLKYPIISGCLVLSESDELPINASSVALYASRDMLAEISKENKSATCSDNKLQVVGRALYIAPAAFLIGDVWYGIQEQIHFGPHCPSYYPTLEVALQSLGGCDNDLVFLFMTTGYWGPEMGTCYTQVLNAGRLSNYVLSTEPIVNGYYGYYYELGYYMCTNINEPGLIRENPVIYQVSEDYNTMIGLTPDGCCRITLQRPT